MSPTDPIPAHIHEAASRALALQTTVSENKHATAALCATTASLDAARAQLAIIEKEICVLQDTLRAAVHERQKHNNPPVRRGLLSALGHGATNDIKTAKTRTDYAAALAQQHVLEAQSQLLRRNIQETEPAVEWLRQLTQQTRQSQSTLDELYTSIFDDPAATLFPADAARHKAFTKATTIHTSVLNELTTQKQALKLLHLAEDGIRTGALKPLDRAATAISRISLTPGLVAELDFSTSLKRIAVRVCSAAQNVERAGCTGVVDVKAFVGLVARTRNHADALVLRAELVEMHRRVVAEFEAGRERVRALEAGERDAVAWLGVARSEMLEGREAMVRAVVGGAPGAGGGAIGGEAPPAYDALAC